MGNLASSGTPRVSNCLLTDPSRSRHPHLPARRASSSASSTVRPGSHPPTRPGRRAPCARATRRGTQRQDPAHGSSRAGRGPEAHAALARAVGRLREVGRPLGHLPVVASPGVRVPGSPSPGAGAHVVVARGWPPIPRHARWMAMGTLPSVVAPRRRPAATEPSRLTGGPPWDHSPE